VASKGLDFPNILHVINFDMPKDIETYGMEGGGRRREEGGGTEEKRRGEVGEHKG
jgi:superfamily II DNA/RNA helicase